jgi:hypothetical protein
MRRRALRDRLLIQASLLVTGACGLVAEVLVRADPRMRVRTVQVRASRQVVGIGRGRVAEGYLM